MLSLFVSLLFQKMMVFFDYARRAAWKPNATSVVVAFDPSSPNIVAFRFIGADVQKKLRRQFWIELQSRFGNIYYVRDEVCTGVVALLAATTHMLLLFFNAQVEGVSCVANELSDTESLFHTRNEPQLRYAIEAL